MEKYRGTNADDSPWERFLGRDAGERTHRLGHESHAYRQSVNLPQANRFQQEQFNKFIHELGADSLRTQMDIQKEIEQEQERLAKKKQRVAKILRRKIKVTDLDDGGVTVSIDQEWDTSTWNDDLVKAGCEALIYIFFDSSGESSEERKERAVHMLQTLLFRHTAADKFMRKNIEALVSKAANKLIRGGKTQALPDIFYVLRSCKDGYVEELSKSNFNGKTFECFMQESRLAAIVIQHTIRSRRSRSKNYSVPCFEGFGSEQEIRATRMAVVNARGAELRTRWGSMHVFSRDRVRKQIGGVRGPIHVGAKYTSVALEIVQHLVSPKAKALAHSNREDVVRAQGCIMVSKQGV